LGSNNPRRTKIIAKKTYIYISVELITSYIFLLNFLLNQKLKLKISS